MDKRKKQFNSGFTLIELLAVIAILAIIMIIAVPTVLTTIATAKKVHLKIVCWELLNRLNLILMKT